MPEHAQLEIWCFLLRAEISSRPEYLLNLRHEPCLMPCYVLRIGGENRDWLFSITYHTATTSPDSQSSCWSPRQRHSITSHLSQSHPWSFQLDGMIAIHPSQTCTLKSRIIFYWIRCHVVLHLPHAWNNWSTLSIDMLINSHCPVRLRSSGILYTECSAGTLCMINSRIALETSVALGNSQFNCRS